ncbi:hypothetical protein V5799_028639 [Amblyomma americanum]|uniref:Uncharacterized protein n=1 Tax=Amblyomma americanum TaxID=6943 RepID=A0AAQ4DCA4_AMBAM
MSKRIEMTFDEVQQDKDLPERVVLVLDTSTSMELLAADKEFTDELETKFHVDAAFGNSTVVYVSQNHPEELRIDASLIDPDNQPCQGCRKTTKGKEITITIPSPAKVGNWTLRLTSPSPSPVKVNVRVESKPKGKDDELIRVSCEMSYLIVDKFDKAVIYAKVTKGTKPVVDAVVNATVHRPGDNPHAIKIPLYDDAEKPATGTSSESASEFQVSMFEIIEGTTEDTTADPVDYFQRVASGGSFQVTEDIVEEDVPPGKIWDLAVKDVRPGMYLTLLVELTWMWPGAHLTSGMGKYFKKRRVLLSSEGHNPLLGAGFLD